MTWRRSQHAAVLLMRLMDRRRLVVEHQQARVFKNLLHLVHVRCAGCDGRQARLLGVVYKIPADVMPKIRECHQRLSYLHGDLLFASTDDQVFEPGLSTVTEQDGSSYDPGDLATMKRRRGPTLRWESEPDKPWRSGGTREWAPLCDILDFKLDDDSEHVALVARCRSCGTRPAADRRNLVQLARRALSDGKIRRAFL